MYNLNPEAAKQADQMSGRIDKTGKYIGKFTLAENVVSTNGTKGVEFSFKSEDGQSADYLKLWTINKDGKEVYGFKVLMAIMTCLRVRNTAPVMQTVEKYDFDARKVIASQAEVFPELMNKPIGLLLQVEEYMHASGAVKSKMNIFSAFEPSTNLTASEILANATTPEAMEKMLATLHDKLLPPNAGAPAGGPAPTGGFGGGEDFDDDIPF